MQKVSLTQELHKLQKNRQFLATMVLLFVCVIFWTVVTLVTSQNSTKVESQLTLLALPLTPTLDEQVISEIEAKRYYSAEELASFTIYKLVIDQENPSGRVVSIDTPDPESEQSATQAPVQNEVTTAPSPSPSVAPSQSPAP